MRGLSMSVAHAYLKIIVRECSNSFVSILNVAILSTSNKMRVKKLQRKIIHFDLLY